MAIVLVTCPIAAQPQTESNWYAHLTLGTDRVRHGFSQVDSSASIELGADYQHSSGAFFGASIANADYATDAFIGSLRDEQFWLYAGYSWDNPEWLINANVARYVYPGLAIDYDYTALSVGLVYRNRYLASISYTDELLGVWGSAIEFEVGLAWPLPGDFEIGGTIGRFRASDFFVSEHTQWNVGVSRTIQRFGIDVRFHDTTAARVTPLGYPASDSWILSVSYALKQ